MKLMYTRCLVSALLLSMAILILPNIATATIIFRASPTGRSDIYIMNDDGSYIRQLTNTLISEYDPLLSPDHKHILFRRDLGGGGQQFDIFIMEDIDGSNERRLTFHPKNDGCPTWSPDGQHIAFSSSRSGNREIHIMEITSRTIRQLTKNEPGEALFIRPKLVT